jgi:hypothetical protein
MILLGARVGLGVQALKSLYLQVPSDNVTNHCMQLMQDNSIILH